MIPHTVQLKNFLSYGPQLQTIDFTQHTLICLSGKNGHGKSALLDAITWALWGQARKVMGNTKPDAGLLRLGHTHMMVILDFECNGKLYRIRREYMETHNKPIAVLEFGMIDPETNQCIALTDKTIKATQKKIESILRLDFDSFSNSAFLRQGNSNEFSKKTPKERKQILATILGLDHYEEIRKCALEKIKDATNQKTVLLLLQEKRNQDLSLRETITENTRLLEQEKIKIDAQEKQWQETKKEIKAQRQKLMQKEEKLLLIKQNKEALTHEYTTARHGLFALWKQWRTVRKRAQFHDLTKLEAEKKTYSAFLHEQQRFLQEYLTHKEQLLSINEKRTALEQQHTTEQQKKIHALELNLEKMYAEYTTKKNIADLIAQELTTSAQEHEQIHTLITSLNAQQETLKSTFSTLAHTEKTLEKHKALYHRLVATGNMINTELNSAQHKKNLMHEDDPSCPLCEQNLSASRKRFLKTKFESAGSLLAHQLKRLKRIIPALKELLITQHATLTEQKAEEQKYTAQLNKITELTLQGEKIVTHIATLHKKHELFEKEIEALETTIAAQKKNIEAILTAPITITSAEYTVLQNQQQQLESYIQKTLYSPKRYEETQQKLTALEASIQECDSFRRESMLHDQRKNEIVQQCTLVRKIQQKHKEYEAQLAQYTSLEQEKNALTQQELTLDQRKNEIDTTKEALQHQKGSLENQQKHLENVQQLFDLDTKKITGLNLLIDDYQTIATTMGKDGIQALLIEDAIPEIEQEANNLLSQLTNNQAHIFIESLKDLKRGGTKETLDIKISDQNGIRPYEMFSGGEAFRIDFALRIALSKLLARRAGTALQTLIIDEGFGSQDEEGLSHIMDALHAIQNNFSKIIIVSHLHSMKDQFPVHFIINKSVQGSTVSVIEQG